MIRRTKKTTLALNLFLLLVAVGGGTIATYINLTDLKVSEIRWISIAIDN